MGNETYKISQLPEKTSADSTDLMEVSTLVDSSYESKKISVGQIAETAMGTMTYEDLTTTAKTIVGAINELVNSGPSINVEELNVTTNGTYTAPEGTAYSPVNVNVQPDLGAKSITANGTYNAVDDSLDGYSSVTVNVQPKKDFVEKWDFTTGSLVGENGTAVTLGGSASVAENTGVSFTTGADRIYMPTQMLKAGRKIDIEFGTMERSNNSSGVVMAWSTSSSSDIMNIQYRSNMGKWIIEYPSVESSNISDAQYFSNSKMSIVIDADSKIHIYRDDTAVWNPTTVLTFSGLNFWTIGANHNNFTYFNAVIRKITISEVPSKSELDALIDRSITSISSDTVERVGAYAFNGCTYLTQASSQSATSIDAYAFYNCSNLTTISFPVAARVGNYTFQNCTGLTDIAFPSVTTIDAYAFSRCTNLTTISFPVVTRIDPYAFFNCTGLTNASFQFVTSITSNVFDTCSSLTNVSFPVATSIGSSAFSRCSNLTDISFPVVKTISDNAFYNCTKLTEASFQVATSVGNAAFSACSNLTNISFPAITVVNAYVFSGCSNLTIVSFPVANAIGTFSFQNCTKLIEASFPVATNINNAAFSGCSNLTSLVLGNTTKVCSIGNINSFNGTPFASDGTGGTLYVPRDLIESYQTATNWSVILSYPNNQILAIEDM